MLLLEIYVWTVFLSFMFYVIVNSVYDQEINVSYKDVEINPVVVFFIPVINMIFLVYEIVIMAQAIAEWIHDKWM